MKIFIPSWARAATIKTHRLMPGADWKIVVHSDNDAKWYSKNKDIPPANVVVSGLPYGNGGQRNWILDNLVKEGEWFCMADDNISEIFSLPMPLYKLPAVNTSQGQPAAWHRVFKNQIPWKDFEHRAAADILEAESRQAKLVGYATNTSPLFRKKKYRDVGYVTTKLCLIKKAGARFDSSLMCKVDYEFTAANLALFGRVLINNFVYPNARHFEPGGIGTVQERTPMNLYGCRYLMQKYAGLFDYHTRAGRQEKSEIKIRLTSIQQVEAWQAKRRKKALYFL